MTCNELWFFALIGMIFVTGLALIGLYEVVNRVFFE